MACLSWCRTVETSTSSHYCPSCPNTPSKPGRGFPQPHKAKSRLIWYSYKWSSKPPHLCGCIIVLSRYLILEQGPCPQTRTAGAGEIRLAEARSVAQREINREMREL